MVSVGVHVSIAGGIDRAVDRAVAAGCDTFQIFSRNPRGWASKPLSQEEAASFVRKLKEAGIGPAVDHMPYLPNLASPKEEVYAKSIDALAEELSRCRALEISYLVTHLGSHLGSGWDEGCRRIVAAAEEAFSRAGGGVMLLLENTAGGKNTMGGSFEEIARIADALEGAGVGVCLDTCHLFGAGYDLRTPEAVAETLDKFDGAVGLDRLKLIHLNDTKSPLGSKTDRHEHIGLGEIGEKGFAAVLATAVIRERPMILETPVDSRRDDKGNLKAVRDMAARV